MVESVSIAGWGICSAFLCCFVLFALLCTKKKKKTATSEWKQEGTGQRPNWTEGACSSGVRPSAEPQTQATQLMTEATQAPQLPRDPAKHRGDAAKTRSSADGTKPKDRDATDANEKRSSKSRQKADAEQLRKKESDQLEKLDRCPHCSRGIVVFIEKEKTGRNNGVTSMTSRKKAENSKTLEIDPAKTKTLEIDPAITPNRPKVAARCPECTCFLGGKSCCTICGWCSK